MYICAYRYKIYIQYLYIYISIAQYRTLQCSQSALSWRATFLFHLSSAREARFDRIETHHGIHISPLSRVWIQTFSNLIPSVVNDGVLVAACSYRSRLCDLQIPIHAHSLQCTVNRRWRLRWYVSVLSVCACLILPIFCKYANISVCIC